MVSHIGSAAYIINDRDVTRETTHYTSNGVRIEEPGRKNKSNKHHQTRFEKDDSLMPILFPIIPNILI